MSKTNGCLVAHACARYVLGWPKCDHMCDVEFVDGVKASLFGYYLNATLDALPSIYRKTALEHVKSLYFADKEEENVGNDPPLHGRGPFALRVQRRKRPK